MTELTVELTSTVGYIRFPKFSVNVERRVRLLVINRLQRHLESRISSETLYVQPLVVVGNIYITWVNLARGVHPP